ncbi:helicase-exonuclease AddAB subunit AddA [Companilactobacillus allii]|uniref:ATP-dependent helicase/nuclease subunit A n=1 Tax=Companilactobacillus allii TaxID=1847728 RepID=A0A1P8Q4T5_9LACO|nr:helicase-exonuclease AddAB subunit AddA [Companilactobacillus allii]APX72809.1 helicase-exonuclease AddAB subunit AddA [Companilactobacillus allii]USQ67598.1 helicase-exonuclease AddAB subunit AddA [Companilactobacillus allii]
MPEWTNDQKKAIFHSGHDILVSAAAGSGKTTILIERIVEMLKQNKSIDNLLVATFTDAAAKEMKDRLVARIKEIINDEEIDHELKRHLQEQIFKIPSANISTLHAFCLSIIKKFYYVIDLDPNFRLLSDDTERSMIQEQAFDNVRNYYYEKDDEDFLNLTENFSNDRSDDGLVEVVFNLYNFAITNSKTDEWLDGLSSNYRVNKPFSESKFYQNYFIPQLSKSLQQIIDESKGAINIANDDQLAVNYVVVFKDLIEQLTNIELNINKVSYDELRQSILDIKLKRAKAIKKADKEGVDTDILESVKATRGLISKQLTTDLINDFFLQNEDGTIETMNLSVKLIEKLVEVEHRFMKEFSKLKLDNHSLDFNDLEHKAVLILTSSVDDKKVALNYYQNKFSEIMIDEYQDVNAMQEDIIQLLSNDDNHIFMVGDIKQSIYGFRQAAPYIFAQKYAEFQKDENPNELINLSMNFRSSGSVDDFINAIFMKIFDKSIGDIDYDDNSKLIEGTNFSKDVDSNNEMYIVSRDKNVNAVTKRQSQIEFAATRIKELVDSKFQIFDNKHQTTRDIKYSDIAILSRTKNNNTDLISYFAKAEIPLMVTDAQNYFQTTELQIMMSMLQIVDNPRQDIPLVAVLRSPIVGLNEEDLAEIRLVDKSDDYLTAMKSYLVKNTDDNLKNKIKTFFIQLETYRDFANKSSIARLIWKIYQETGLLEYVSGMPGGKQRSANLHALYQRASSYEETNLKGLHQFIDFIQRMEKMNKDLAQPNSVEAVDDTVKVMTVHASKGLEFPVVLFLDVSHGFNTSDYIGDTLFDVDLGMGVTVLDTNSRIAIHSMQRSLIAAKKKVSTISEEMRLLYVALTRAKQKIIMIGFEKDPEKLMNSWDQATVQENGVLDEASRLSSKNYQNLVGMSVLDYRDRVNNDSKYVNESAHVTLEIMNEESNSIESVKSDIESSAPQEVSKKFKDTVNKLINFNYKYQESVETTAYQSVSDIKGLFADPDDDNMGDDLLSENGKYIKESFSKPKFLNDTNKVSSAEVGSATHLLLQKINIESIPNEQAFKTLLDTSIAEGTISDQVAKRIDLNSLVKFYQSDLGEIILKNHDDVSREFPFSVLMPAKMLFKNSRNSDYDDERILVHGIIDVVIELEDSIILFDYKTDNVNSKSIHQAIDNYSGQLNLYAQAISAIRHKPVKEKYLYFLKINQAVNLSKNNN